jgi:hypothetical protein
MVKNAGDYGQIVETVHLDEGKTLKVGFHEGKWIAATKHEKVAISKNGFLLCFRCNETGRAHSYKMYLNFADLAADDVDFCLLSKVAAAIDADYVAFLD